MIDFFNIKVGIRDSAFSLLPVLLMLRMRPQLSGSQMAAAYARIMGSAISRTNNEEVESGKQKWEVLEIQGHL